jgi:hypothetical protein
MPTRFRRRDLSLQRLALLRGRRDAQAVVIQNLERAPLSGVEIVDKVPRCHLVELDASQLAQPLTSLVTQPFRIADGGSQGAVQLAFLAMQLGDCTLDRSQRLPSRPHRQLTTL